MKLRLNTFIFLLFAFVNTLIAQPPNATISPDCSQLQNVSLQIDVNTNTFSLAYTQPSGQYIVWDLHQETAAGDIVVNYGATDTQIAAEPLNSNPNDGNYYIKVWIVCKGDGTYDGALIIGLFIISPQIILIEDALVAYISLPDNNPCNPYTPDHGIFNFCETIYSGQRIELIVFGCNPPKSITKDGKIGVDNSYGVSINRGSFGSFFNLSIDGNSGYYIKNDLSNFVRTGLAKACKTSNNIEAGNKIQNNDTNTIIYPNPTSGDLNVKFNLENTSNIDIQVYNLQSQMVKVLKSQQEVTKGSYSETFDVSSLQAGFYFLEIMTNEGKTVHKFMKN